MKLVSLVIDVELEKDIEATKVAERLFDFLASDPDDLFPEITVVINYDVLTSSDATNQQSLQ